MPKVLYTKDYNKMVFDAILLPVRDHEKYFQTMISDNIKNNKDIVMELTASVYSWIDWFNNTRPVTFVDQNQQGGLIFFTRDEKVVNLFNDYNVDAYVTMDYLNGLLNVLKSVNNPKEERSTVSKNTNPKNKDCKMTILDIWVPDNRGSTQEYDKQLENLTLFCPDVDDHFLIKINDQWKLNEKIDGIYSYIAGWLHICYQRHWIERRFTSEQYKLIINNTFHAEIKSKTHFNSIYNTPPNFPKYTEPFQKMPTNV